MTHENPHDAAHHLREALRHLKDARTADLRQTHAVAIEQAAETIARVLREHEQDG